jgi:death-on-curing protein
MRVENRLQYGLVNDVFELATFYAVSLATGHCFNDANKRTAVNVMDACLALNRIDLQYETVELGDKVIAVANGKVDEFQLADWLRVLEIKL